MEPKSVLTDHKNREKEPNSFFFLFKPSGNEHHTRKLTDVEKRREKTRRCHWLNIRRRQQQQTMAYLRYGTGAGYVFSFDAVVVTFH